MTVTAYPGLTQAEFSKACQAFEARCCDGLDGTDWLSVKWTGQELRIKVRRPYDGRSKSDRDYDDGKEEKGGENMEEIYEAEEDRDELTGQPEDLKVQVIHIDFSINLSPTYSVPVLWFTSSALKSVDQIHEVLLPDHLDAAVRQVGVMGGLSQAYHPISDLPAFFIHPCNTHEGMASVNDGEDLNAEEYLLVWLGLIGSGVGLHVPSKLVGKA